MARYASRTLNFLDISSSRGITDSGLGTLLNSAPRLKRVMVWGATQLSNDVFLGHIRASMQNSLFPWDKENDQDDETIATSTAAATTATPICRAHPDLLFETIDFIGKPGDTSLPPLTTDAGDSEWIVFLT